MISVRRKEIWQALPAVLTITVGSIAGGLLLTTLMMGGIIGFGDARLHYTLAVIFPTILSPCAAFPLVIMSQRLRGMKAELENLLRLDGLTEIPNRRAFFEHAAAVFERKSVVTAMMIDIDHFKAVNDRYGHATGDVVLSTIGHMIQNVVDTAAEGGDRITARIGGEEFSVLVEDMDEEATALLAQRIIDHVRATPVVTGDAVIPVTVSVGFAQRRGETGPDQLLRVADAACYRAKRLGRDRWCSAGDRARTGLETEGTVSPLRRKAAG